MLEEQLPAVDVGGGPAGLIFVERVQVAVDAGLIVGDPTDIALVFFALVEGLAAAENARRLGSTRRSVERRWNLAINALFAGLRV